ncbi:MAG TPA: hypothetical protein VIF09_10380 [Polyangiaceae bacterium]|jgi:hypothetical protein
MDRLLARLERSIGRFAIPNLITLVVGGMGLVWILETFGHAVVSPRILLDMDAVRRGEVWRLATFVFLPIQAQWYWFVFAVYFAWWIGSSLEEHWGKFKLNAFYFTGVLGTIVAALFTRVQTNVWLDLSLFLAFATLFPDVQILLMLILPIRVKWLGIAAAVVLVLGFAQGDWVTRAAILAAMGNYVLFFAGHWAGVWRSRNLQVRQKARRVQFEGDGAGLGQRTCALCGAREQDGADIRVCSCEKCGGQQRTLCLEHARNH